ncbi:hypothetical protein J6590_031916 [Homalodisca vitripennis]|nr:hypothetical protein J6590_031916 [Homalodisca vitripennis]
MLGRSTSNVVMSWAPQRVGPVDVVSGGGTCAFADEGFPLFSSDGEGQSEVGLGRTIVCGQSGRDQQPSAGDGEVGNNQQISSDS